MRAFFVYTLLIVCIASHAQDKVYFLDGTSKAGKITEISSDAITLEKANTEIILRHEVLLLEFKNGSIEILNKATHPVVYKPVSLEVKRVKAETQKIYLYNQVSINSLALCNADISGFYERILPNKIIGLGVMGAYNFNQYAGLQNLFLTGYLTNAKKKYDLGAFANVYLGALDKGTNFYFGIFFKYMHFNFSRVIEEKIVSGGITSTNIKYTPATGNQMATLFTFGIQHNFQKNISIKTIAAIGGFNLRGVYREQYNYTLNQVNKVNQINTDPINRKFLLKIYFGINIGYNF